MHLYSPVASVQVVAADQAIACHVCWAWLLAPMAATILSRNFKTRVRFVAFHCSWQPFGLNFWKLPCEVCVWESMHSCTHAHFCWSCCLSCCTYAHSHIEFKFLSHVMCIIYIYAYTHSSIFYPTHNIRTIKTEPLLSWAFGSDWNNKSRIPIL